MRWRDALRRKLSRPDALLANPRLAWLRKHLGDPRLWHVGRRSVSLGLAIGTGMGILLPIGQIPVAATTAMFLRVNLPAAVLGTFITNGFTYVPIYLLAYALGCAITGSQGLPAAADAMQAGGLAHALEFVRQLPQPWLTLLLPLVIGVVVLAVLVAAGSYVGIRGLWVVQVRSAWRRRHSRTDTRSAMR